MNTEIRSESFELCPECGAQKGINSNCGECARSWAESAGHYGQVDVFGSWICFSGCPVCYPDEG